MKNILRNALLSGSIALLCACGAKGSLFMPEEAPPIELPEPADAEAAPFGVDGEVPPADPMDVQDDGIDADVEPEPEEASTPPDDAG